MTELRSPVASGLFARYGIRGLLLLLTSVALLALLAIVPFEQFQFWGWDVSVFRAGSKALIHGANPYDPGAIVRYSDGAELASIPYFVYAPFFAVLLTPLALVPPEVATRAWFVLNLACLLGASMLTLDNLGWTPTTRGLIMLGIGLALFPPSRTLLVIGQSTGVMLLLLVIGLRLLVRGRAWLAGGILALALFKPHLVLVPLFLLIRKHGRSLAGMGAAMVVTSLPFVSLLDDWIAALVRVRAVNVEYGCLDFSSLNMLLRCLEFSPIAILAALLIPSVVTIWLVRPPASPGSERFQLQLALVICLSMLVLDNVRVADLVLLIFPALVVSYSLSQSSFAPARRLAMGALLAAYLFPYLAQAYGTASGAPLLFSQPIWYAGTAVAMYLAVAIVLVGQQDTSARTGA